MLRRRQALKVIGAVLVGSPSLWAEGKKDYRTHLVIKGLHCQFCAQRLCTELKKIPGVSDAKADAKTGKAIVVPVPGKQLPSPKSQWETVQKAGFTPVKLTSPHGQFTSKPKI
ncbi:MAG: heavy-metal-associated domain-containing protein [Planctomycetales bacterium]|nr:heavy-metal-associated domain-containing protein [Planctomycetales bacterium]